MERGPCWWRFSWSDGCVKRGPTFKKNQRGEVDRVTRSVTPNPRVGLGKVESLQRHTYRMRLVSEEFRNVGATNIRGSSEEDRREGRDALVLTHWLVDFGDTDPEPCTSWVPHISIFGEIKTVNVREIRTTHPDQEEDEELLNPSKVLKRPGSQDTRWDHWFNELSDWILQVRYTIKVKSLNVTFWIIWLVVKLGVSFFLNRGERNNPNLFKTTSISRTRSRG